MRNVMIDLETMGTGPRSAIASIGAVLFDPAGTDIESTFYCRVDLQSSVRAGMIIDAATVLWWMQQSDQARSELLPGDHSIPLHLALYDLRRFVIGADMTADEEQVIPWANGASFDFPILSEAYRLVGIKPPWLFRNERDWRTVRKLVPHVRLERDGTQHNALDDAIHQVKHLQLVMRALSEAIQPAETCDA